MQIKRFTVLLDFQNMLNGTISLVLMKPSIQVMLYRKSRL